MDAVRRGPACGRQREPYEATGSLGAWSLALPAGASAQSPFTCVEPNDRTFRLFARSEGSASKVLASVVYETVLGSIAIPVGIASETSGWQPTAAFHTGVLLGALLSEGSIHVALRFTALSGARASTMCSWTRACVASEVNGPALR